MKCEPGFHTYRPFPRSRDLFCSSCGDQPGDHGWKQNGTHTAALVAPPEQAELPFDPPPPRDPEAEMARRIIEEQRGKNAAARDAFELKIMSMLDESGIESDAAVELLQGALDFGPELDLDQFAELIAAHRPAPPEDDASTAI